MKKIHSFLGILFLILLIASPAVLAESVDLSAMTIEELLILRDSIDNVLEEKGHRVYFDIERGAKSEEVSRIQERLTALGYYSGNITGKFDSETQKAFKFFEKANGLKNDGMASRADQIALFSENALAKSTPVPSAAPESAIAATPRPQHDVSFDYEQCLRFPDEAWGSAFQLKGRVEQVLGSREEGFQIRFAVLGSTDEIIYVFLPNDPGYNILEDDWLVLQLTMTGTVTYESIWGQEITIPSAVSSEVILQ